MSKEITPKKKLSKRKKSICKSISKSNFCEPNLITEKDIKKLETTLDTNSIIENEPYLKDQPLIIPSKLKYFYMNKYRPRKALHIDPFPEERSFEEYIEIISASPKMCNISPKPSPKTRKQFIKEISEKAKINRNKKNTKPLKRKRKELEHDDFSKEIPTKEMQISKIISIIYQYIAKNESNDSEDNRSQEVSNWIKIKSTVAKLPIDINDGEYNEISIYIDKVNEMILEKPLNPIKSKEMNNKNEQNFSLLSGVYKKYDKPISVEAYSINEFLKSGDKDKKNHSC